MSEETTKKFNLNSNDLAEELAKPIAYLIQNSKTDVDDDYVKAITEAVSSKLAEEEPVTAEEAFNGTIGIAKVITEATDTPWDDRAVSLLNSIVDGFGLKAKATAWLDKVLGKK